MQIRLIVKLFFLLSCSCICARTFADACSSIAGATYVSDVVNVYNVDIRTTTVRSFLLQINADGTLIGYNSGEIERLDSQYESIPSLGSWVCNNGILYGVMLDYFNYGLSSKDLFWKETDRITLKIDPKTLKMDTVIVGMPKGIVGSNNILTNMSTKPIDYSVISPIRHLQLKKLTEPFIIHAVENDFALSH